MENWLKLISAFITGGVIWEGFKFLFPEVKQRIQRYHEARKTFYQNLDPILKSADELYGKIYSLSKEDFATFINPQHSNSENPDHNKQYVLYLFSQFWAQLEMIRLRSQYTALTEFQKGKQLINFIETIESRDFRILDRSVQRIIGEAMIDGATSNFTIMNLNQFIKELELNGSEIKKWTKQLEVKLNAAGEKVMRQRILVFGVIVAAFIDHFDPHHRIIHPNTVYKNKLSTLSKKNIKKNLFQHYLKFIRNRERYF